IERGATTCGTEARRSTPPPRAKGVLCWWHPFTTGGGPARERGSCRTRGSRKAGPPVTGRGGAGPAGVPTTGAAPPAATPRSSSPPLTLAPPDPPQAHTPPPVGCLAASLLVPTARPARHRHTASGHTPQRRWVM